MLQGGEKWLDTFYSYFALCFIREVAIKEIWRGHGLISIDSFYKIDGYIFVQIVFKIFVLVKELGK